MQRFSQLCCRLTPLIRNSFFLHQEGNGNFLLMTQAQNAFHKRLKHAVGDETAHKEQATSQFTGYIPVEELEFSYSRSSGPGGQHVNKVSTKVEVRFHVASASWLPEDIKNKLIETERNRITKEGYLILTSDRTRKQLLNQADVMDKLRSMVFRASIKPRGLTEDEIALRDKRLHKAKERTLREKRQHSVTKQSRGSI